MRLGLVLGYGNGFGVEAGPECWGGGEGVTPPPLSSDALPPPPPVAINDTCPRNATTRPAPRSVIPAATMSSGRPTVSPGRRRGGGAPATGAGMESYLGPAAAPSMDTTDIARRWTEAQQRGTKWGCRGLRRAAGDCLTRDRTTRTGTHWTGGRYPPPPAPGRTAYAQPPSP